MAGVFPFWQIALDAAVAFVASLGLLVTLRQQFKVSLTEAAIMAGMAGLSVPVWRSFANTPTLNNDPTPPISPDDTLSPFIAYVALGMTAAFSRPQDGGAMGAGAGRTRHVDLCCQSRDGLQPHDTCVRLSAAWGASVAALLNRAKGGSS